MEFLNLERGDKNNLEGKVIIYARPRLGPKELKKFGELKKDLIDHPEIIEEILPGIDPSIIPDLLNEINENKLQNYNQNIIVAMYATSNITDIKEKFPESISGDLEDVITQEIKEKEAHLPKGEKIKNYYAGIYFTSLDDIKNSKEDVINLDTEFNQDYFRIASMGLVQFYMAHYNQQRETKADYSKSKQSKEQTNGKITPIITYENMQSGERINHMQSKYISPIMLELERNNIEQAKQISQDFIRYSENSALEDDSYAIAAVLNLDKPEHAKYKTSLMDNYFSKIIAITQERYKDAAKHRDVIKDIQGKMKESGNNQRNNNSNNEDKK
ncbi:MAG: hypothetical protein WCX73_01835 [Candidatus Pacearchaeota archaeon]|jgi:hypothetical protein